MGLLFFIIFSIMVEEVAVMDYSTGDIWLYNLPHTEMSCEDVEEWLDAQGFNLNDIYYMINQHIGIKDER